MKKTTNSKAATIKLGQSLVKQLTGGEVLALIGNLGSGKTTFVKGLARGLGIKQPITSPTFVLLKVYPVTKHKIIKQLVHVDCYRLPAGRHGVPGIELAKISLDDYLNDHHTITVIEWAEKIKLPRGSKKIYFKHGQSYDERIVKLF